jgi:large subunit ribosomal protein L13
MSSPIKREIRVLDASGRPVGRLATEVAMMLMGKNKATYAPNVDAGDFVHVKNAAKSVLTGKKMAGKVYKHYTGYQGGLREKKVSVVWAADPSEVLRRAVKNMLPKNSHQMARLRRLRVTN